ncbi:MAG: selenocysteine-specific translation elongation factor [Deltaproteobacteria bacterium RIFOXYD12_FULL_57_12]|nr:MAG: selenocysteine-specific translation elongation factor [Deltaproteobacteria bacterium RIFOXYD12_FULL_57_12]
MREIILGTAGHVDHGKTSLVKALTGIDTDRLKEEKERGITIELGFAFLDLPCGHRLGIIDVPGHEKFVRNMVAGAAGLDLVAFIVAADEGIMPQTREHFEICRLLGIKRGIIIITKKDMVDPDWLELVQEETREFLADSFLAEAPMIAVSSITGEGIEEVRTVLDGLVKGSEFIEAHGPFRMPVDRVFTMKGFGAVVTGTSISGRIKAGEPVMIYPRKLPAKIRGIQVHGREVGEVEAGHRTAINLHGVEKEMIERGDLVASPDCLQPSLLLDVDFLYLAANKKNLKNRARVRVHLGTAEILARIVLLDAEELAPGASANVQLRLEKTLAVWPGDRFVVRSYSPVTTIGGGGVLNAAPRRRRRFRPETARIFELYRTGASEELALFHLQESSYLGLTFDRLTVKMGIFGNRLKKILINPLSTKKILVIESDRQRMLAASVYEKLIEKTREILTGYHRDNPLKAGLSKEELRSRLYQGLDPRLFQYLLNDLDKKNLVELDQALIRLAGHKVALKDEEDTLRRGLDTLFREAGLAPPTVKEVYARFAATPPAQVNQILAVLSQENILVRITEGLYFHQEVLTELVKRVKEFMAAEGEIDAPRIKTLTGVSRKFCIPLLEYFDRIKLTIRVGDKRILR